MKLILFKSSEKVLYAMGNKNIYWLVVGHEFKKNELKKVYMMSNDGQSKKVTPSEFARFSSSNTVLNARTNGSTMVGVGISLKDLPLYKEIDGIVQLTGGRPINYIIAMAQPQIQKYIQAQQEQNKDNKTEEETKEQKIVYIVKKLSLCNYMLMAATKMKEGTNAAIVEQNLDRYLKQIDVDNMDISFRDRVKRYGVLGLVRGVQDTVDRCIARAEKYHLMDEYITKYISSGNIRTLRDLVNVLKKTLNEVIKLHNLSKQLTKENRTGNTENKITAKQAIEKCKSLVTDKYISYIESIVTNNNVNGYRLFIYLKGVDYAKGHITIAEDKSLVYWANRQGMKADNFMDYKPEDIVNTVLKLIAETKEPTLADLVMTEFTRRDILNDYSKRKDKNSSYQPLLIFNSRENKDIEVVALFKETEVILKVKLDKYTLNTKNPVEIVDEIENRLEELENNIEQKKIRNNARDENNDNHIKDKKE